jgi:hypothetical protein
VDAVRGAAQDAADTVTGAVESVTGIDETPGDSQGSSQTQSVPTGTRRAVARDARDGVNDPLVLEDATRADLARIQRKGRALGRAQEATAGPEPRSDFGDQYVPEPIEDGANQFRDALAGAGQAGANAAGELTAPVPDYAIVPTAGGVTAIGGPDESGDPTPVQQGFGDVVAAPGDAVVAGVEVSETGAYVVGGTGLSGGSTEETARRVDQVAEEGERVAEQSVEFALENPARFTVSAGVGAAVGSAASRAVPSGSTTRRAAASNTARTYINAAPTVDTPNLDYTRTLRGSDRGQGDLTLNQDQNTQSEAEVQVERGSEEAAEAEGSVEEFMEREPANAAFRQENINQGQGPSTPLAVERGLDDVTSEDFGLPSNVERTALDRESSDLRDRLPDESEFESQEAYEAELEILRERVATETEADTQATQQVSGELEQELVAGTESGANSATTTGILAGSDTREQTVDLDIAGEGQQEAEITIMQERDAGLLTGVATEQQQNQAQDQGVGLDVAQELQQQTEVAQTTDQTQTVELDLGQDQRQTQDQTTDLDTTQRTQQDTRQALEQELTTSQRAQQDVDLQVESDSRQRTEFDLDAGSGESRRREDVFGGQEQRFEFDTLDL